MSGDGFRLPNHRSAYPLPNPLARRRLAARDTCRSNPLFSAVSSSLERLYIRKSGRQIRWHNLEASVLVEMGVDSKQHLGGQYLSGSIQLHRQSGFVGSVYAHRCGCLLVHVLTFVVPVVE